MRRDGEGGRDRTDRTEIGRGFVVGWGCQSGGVVRAEFDQRRQAGIPWG
jgi:hypothetical protein